MNALGGAQEAARWLLHLALESLGHLLVLGLPLLLPALLMQGAAGLLERQAVRSLGARPYLLLFAWLGTAVHELGHAFFHLVFGHRITGMKLFSLDPQSETLGYVRFEYQPGKLRHRLGLFFSGIGPILVGSVLILLAAQLLIPHSLAGAGLSGAKAPVLHAPSQILSWLMQWSRAVWTLGRELPELILQAQWRGLAFLWLAFSVGSSITLSPADLRLAGRGAITLLASGFLLICALRLLGISVDGWVQLLAGQLALLPPLLMLVVGLNLAFWMVLKAMELAAGRLRG